MTIQIKLEYEGYFYLSAEDEADENTLEKARDMLDKISKSKVENLVLKNRTKEYYFNKSILEKSVITLIIN